MIVSRYVSVGDGSVHAVEYHTPILDLAAHAVCVHTLRVVLELVPYHVIDGI